jgi:hypothetical protein
VLRPAEVRTRLAPRTANAAGVLRGLAHRGGLRADVLSRAVGSEPATDSVEALP